MRPIWRYGIDALVIAAAMLYIVAGMPLATFHGDEAMQIAMSADYWRGVVDGDWGALTTAPPYLVDSESYLRLINGSVNRYTIGLTWHLAGYAREQLPPMPGWQWALSYTDNIGLGFRPDQALLTLSRLPSTVFLALSVLFVYALGHFGGGRVGAVIATCLYALNPSILLNGRRAMQEGALLCLGLCALWIAAHIARQRATRGRAAPTAWIILIAACALTLANKHSGAAFVAAAFMGIAAAEWIRRVYIRRIVPFMARLIGAGAAVLALFVVLSPALWNDPSARLRDLLMVRAELLDMQVTVNGGALTLPERLNAIITQPFFALPIHYEAAFWGEEPDILDEIERYHAAGLSGFYPGVLALLVLGLAAAGIVSLIGAMRGRRLEQRAYAGGLLMTLCVMIGVSLASPLAWQRYYLPLLPVVYLCAACAPRAFWHAFDHDA